jgi:hypothetical protein
MQIRFLSSRLTDRWRARRLEADKVGAMDVPERTPTRVAQRMLVPETGGDTPFSKLTRFHINRNYDKDSPTMGPAERNM